MKRESSALILGIMIVIMIAGNVSIAEAQSEPVLTIAVSVTPLAGIAEKVGGGYNAITTILPEGVEPHAAQLPQDAVNAANDADLLILTGHFSWEDNLLEQVNKPYISLEDYEMFGAELSPLPGEEHDSHALAQDDHDHHEGNIHSYWLLPKNAIAIANATMNAFMDLAPGNSEHWQLSFDGFVADVERFLDLVDEADEEYSFSELHAVVVFPAEAYVAEAFGIEVEGVLQEGDNVFISGAELVEVQRALGNGSIDLILGSDIARLQAGGEFATQLAEDTNSKIIWFRAIFFSGLSDYLSVMTYNLGSLTSGLEAQAPVQNNSGVLVGFIGIIVVLGIMLLVETVLLVRKVREV